MSHWRPALLFIFWNRVSLCGQGWPQTCDPFASATWGLGLQMCTTTPSSDFFLVTNP
jgi:hypothetical protein